MYRFDNIVHTCARDGVVAGLRRQFERVRNLHAVSQEGRDHVVCDLQHSHHARVGGCRDRVAA